MLDTRRVHTVKYAIHVVIYSNIYRLYHHFTVQRTAY